MNVFTRVIDSCGGISFIYTPEGLSLLDLTTGNAIAVEAAQDVIITSVSLTVDSNSANAAVVIYDTSMSDQVFATWAAAITWLNTNIPTLHSTFKGEFYRNATGQLTLKNTNRYGSDSAIEYAMGQLVTEDSVTTAGSYSLFNIQTEEGDYIITKELI